MSLQYEFIRENRTAVFITSGFGGQDAQRIGTIETDKDGRVYYKRYRAWERIGPYSTVAACKAGLLGAREG